MIEFNLSQMTALILVEHVAVSPYLRSQINSAPVKADTWCLRCEKEELIMLNQHFAKALVSNKQLTSGVKAMVIEELAKRCRQLT